MHEFNNYNIINLKINNKIYKLWVADTEEKKRIGLSQVSKLKPLTGMIFVYTKPVRHSFTMKNTKIPLTMIFLDNKGNVVYQKKCKPYQKEKVRPKSDFYYVIEI